MVALHHGLVAACRTLAPHSVWALLTQSQYRSVVMIELFAATIQYVQPRYRSTLEWVSW
jgi:hypothetical protein